MSWRVGGASWSPSTKVLYTTPPIKERRVLWCTSLKPFNFQIIYTLNYWLNTLMFERKIHSSSPDTFFGHIPFTLSGGPSCGGTKKSTAWATLAEPFSSQTERHHGETHDLPLSAPQWLLGVNRNRDWRWSCVSAAPITPPPPSLLFFFFSFFHLWRFLSIQVSALCVIVGTIGLCL